MANTGNPLSGYTEVTGSFNKAVKKALPKDTHRYKIVNDNRDYFKLDLWVREFYTIGGDEYERWVYMPYTSNNYRNYYTIYVDLVHNVTKTFNKKKIVYTNKRIGEKSFYDSSIEEKLGGEVMNLG